MIGRKQKNIIGSVDHSGSPPIQLLLFFCTVDVQIIGFVGHSGAPPIQLLLFFYTVGAKIDGNDMTFFFLFV